MQADAWRGLLGAVRTYTVKAGYKNIERVDYSILYRPSILITE